MKLIRSAKIVVLNIKNEALLLRRSNTHPRNPLEADLPGGVVEASESIEAGALRELNEETGLKLQQSDLRLLHSFTFNNIPGISISRLLYGARLQEISPAIVLSSEHDEYRWVDISELRGLEEPYQKGIHYANEHKLWDNI
jgi:8-oxo-dGTP pyrophosphatase MutT (NUDIX family)